jgi:hypothetical protein
VSACMVCDGVTWAGGGGGVEDERAVVGSSSPRPPRRQHRGGTPVSTSSEASGRSQQRGCAAGGGEGTARIRQTDRDAAQSPSHERCSRRSNEVPESVRGLSPSHTATAKISRLWQLYAVLVSIIFNFCPKPLFVL